MVELKIAIVILSVISTSIIPLLFALKRAKENFENAKNDADKESAIIDMFDVVRELIEVAERTYTEATGSEKKSAVLKSLGNYANAQNYSFDIDYWGTIIDKLVSMTKNVNITK